jgi:hypothetical protein
MGDKKKGEAEERGEGRGEKRRAKKRGERQRDPAFVM